MKQNGFTKRLSFVVLLIAVVAAAVLVNYYISAGNPIKLNTVEVTEYQGQKLSSINDFRENSIKGPQYVNKSNYRLVVTGLVDKNLTFTYDEVISRYKSYEKVVTLNCVEGWDVTILWQGFLVKDLLEDAGVQPGAKVVIFYAYDNYTSSLPIDYLTSNNIMIAYKMNGVPLPPERGFPFQLVAESKWGYKWVKWITKIEVSDNANFTGYWEQNGYSNSGDLNQTFWSSP